MYGPRKQTIPQRELRNDVGRILREAEAGTEFTVTVKGRPVARVMPLHDVPAPRRDVPTEEVFRVLRALPQDETWLGDLLAMREEMEPDDDPWET